MKIILAGYNVDCEALQDLLKTRKTKDMVLTPETISAAYARISRSPKYVNALRKEARKEVKKTRRSNRTIIFEMGHHSIAEHAVFNFDIIGISRLAVEVLERFRLCSYTEKSQRYVTLKGDFTLPQELQGTKFVNEFLDIIDIQNKLYQSLCKKLYLYNQQRFPHYSSEKKGKRLLENLAKEDARYILSLATQTQLGATINARNLELMMRRFASHKLSEVRELGKGFYNLVRKIAPSIILFYKANDYDEKTYVELQSHVRKMFHNDEVIKNDYDVDLIDYTRGADDRILAALLFKVSNRTYSQCLEVVKKMSIKEKEKLFKKTCQYMELYDVVPREFEFISLTFSLVVSAACFGQLKRHRIATITSQDYDPQLSFIIPDSIKAVGEEKGFTEIIKKTERVYKKIEKKLPGFGTYILTNAHRKRILLRVNLRELYHISRLREDPTAQWDIREKAQRMSKLAKKVMPITTQLLGGKAEYLNIYYKLFGRMPKVTDISLP